MTETKKVKNSFKNNNEDAIKKAFTSKWVEIINRNESNKSYHLQTK